MKTVRLKTLILRHRFYAILFLGISLVFSGFFVVKNYILDEAQAKVTGDLKTVRAFYLSEISRMQLAFGLAVPGGDLAGLKAVLGLDYLFDVPAAEISRIPSEIVRTAAGRRQPVGSPRIIPAEELRAMPGLDSGHWAVPILDTPKARPVQRRVLESVMSLEYAQPVLDENGRLTRVIYGGKVINHNERLIDEIVGAVFGDRTHKGKPLGTVTIFQDDVRVATNVLDARQQRAVGTRVSAEVYRRVVENGQEWLDRAFVVTDWYLTAYEPIRDIRGRIIGILYVGLLERPSLDMRRNIFAVFLLIVLGTSFLAGVLSVVLARSIHKPITDVVNKSREIADGKLDAKVTERTVIRELNELVLAFNTMADKLARREESLSVSNKKLADLNKDYLELVGFVSHELKGILSSIVLNTYLLHHRVLGEINDKQDKTLQSMAKNLDYLAATVRNFLNLSRIEKGELKLNRKTLRLKEDVFKEAVEAFALAAADKNLAVVNEIADDIRIDADPELLQIAANNLVGNAVKYGTSGGTVVLKSRKDKGFIETEVYNDGRPIAASHLGKLFRKFSRVLYEGMEKIKGTGVGLFITKEIVERHGGRIWVEPREKGNAFKFTVPAG